MVYFQSRMSKGREDEEAQMDEVSEKSLQGYAPEGYDKKFSPGH